ncbi:hypothetical protein PFISCL1PPCAC_1514, partial [Pristionchus fissidentatus]
NEADCNRNVCFLLMECPGAIESIVQKYWDEVHQRCKDPQLVMAVAVNPISARKFEFLVNSTIDSQMILGQKLLIKSGNGTNFT